MSKEEKDIQEEKNVKKTEKTDEIKQDEEKEKTNKEDLPEKKDDVKQEEIEKEDKSEKKENVKESKGKKKKDKKKGNKKILKLVIIILSIIIVLVAITLVVIIPYINYSNGNKEFEKGNYLDAVTYYDKASFFAKQDNYNKSYYNYAELLKENDSCNKAIEYYTKSGLTDDSNEIVYCNKYIENKKNFESAEKKYSDGYLKDAKELYEKIDSDFEYNGVKVSDRLNTLEEYSKFVEITGSKKGTNGYMEIKHVWKYNGSWDSWYNNYSDTATVTCIIQEDGTVKINVVAYFYSYTKWSSLSYALGEKNFSAIYSKTVKKTDNIPSDFGSYAAVVAPSGEVGYAKLTYSKGTFALSFSLNDKNYSTNFSNKYKSTISFK